MRQVIRACTCCLQYEGGIPQAPLCPIVATTPLDLLHVDFTSIETPLDLNQSPRVTTPTMPPNLQLPGIVHII